MLIAALILALVVIVWALFEKAWQVAVLAAAVALIVLAQGNPLHL